jgi:hypothetical protein
LAEGTPPEEYSKQNAAELERLLSEAKKELAYQTHFEETAQDQLAKETKKIKRTETQLERVKEDIEREQAKKNGSSGGKDGMEMSFAERFAMFNK